MLQTKKIIFIIFSIILLFGLFCIPASAETVETLYTDFWTLNTSESKVWYLDTINNGEMHDITSSIKYSVLSDGKLLGVAFYADEDWGANNILYFNFIFDLKPQYCKAGVSSLKFQLCQWNGGRVLFSGTGPNVNTGVRYLPWAYRDGQYYIDDVHRRDYQEFTTEPNANKNAITYKFENQNAEYGFNRVCVFAYCTLQQSLSSGGYRVYFEFAGLDYRYSTEGEYLNQQIINNQNVNTDKIISNAEKNASDIQANADKNASQIQQNQDENTQSIIDNQNQLQENEKAEAQGSGNSAADNVSSAVPDQSAGFISALQTFVKGMSTTDTECTLKVPAIVVPEIPGLFSRTVLIEEQDLSFSQAIKLIPNAILQIVRALTTIGLIVYCFKQLYDTIEYILTMRRGSSNE